VSLLLVNQELWNLEDAIRIEEKNKDWGEDFVEIARNIYKTNDKRSQIKNDINIKYGSTIVEEKSYE